MSTMLYKSGGKHKFHGGNFNYIVVDDDRIADALNDGWFLTTTEAVENVGPTRKELEQKAKELKISFPSNISDEKLLSKINEKINELD